MTLTNKKLVEFVKSKVSAKTAYMWGEFGRIITKSTISQKAAQYPSRYTTDRQKLLSSYVGKGYNGCDCAGLYKWFLWTAGGTSSSIKYSAATDRGTEGMYSVATEKGKISTLPETPGVILYMKGHVGVYIGNGECVECTLGKYGDGVVKTAVKGRGWTHWLKIPEITYETEVEEKPSTDTVKVESKTVTPSVGLWLNNSNTRWNSSTHIVCMPKGSIVTYYVGTDKKLGNYTSVKVTYNGKTGYCAKEYLK